MRVLGGRVRAPLSSGECVPARRSRQAAVDHRVPGAATTMTNGPLRAALPVRHPEPATVTMYRIVRVGSSDAIDAERRLPTLTSNRPQGRA